MKVEIIKNKSNQNNIEKDISLMEAGLEKENNIDSVDKINLPNISESKIISSTPKITVIKNNEIATPDKPKISPRMRKTSFQARLGKRLDNISRKLIDNQIRLTANPTNMIRIRSERDPRSQDLISRTITDAEIVPIILPPMEDIPMRKFINNKGNDVFIPSLYPTSDETYYEIYSPLEVILTEDDLLIRIIEDPFNDNPYILCLQIKEILGTLGYSSFRYQKFWASMYDEELPKPVIKILMDASRTRREELGW